MSYGPMVYGYGAEGGAGRPAVVPRVSHSDGSSSLPIERIILPMLRVGERGLVVITAPPGGGKTTAMQYLQVALEGYGGVRYFDQLPAEACQAAKSSLAILTDVTADLADDNPLASVELSPWTLDDCIEYLAARHRKHLTRILKSVSKDGFFSALNGSPQLLTMVLDAMAGDETLCGTQEAFSAHIEGLHVPGQLRDRLLGECCSSLGIVTTHERPGPHAEPFSPYQYLLRHAAPRRVWVAQSVAMQLSLGKIPASLNAMASVEILSEIAAAVSARTAAVQTLENLLANDPRGPAVPMAASILLRIQPDWRPPDSTRLNLGGAKLTRAKWADIDLERADLKNADLTNADLSGARICDASGANLTGANLQSARLTHANLDGAQLISADLTGAKANKCFLIDADCTGADFTSADLSGAELNKTRLNGAIFDRTDLSRAYLLRTKIENARFDNVDFTKAFLHAVRLNVARWSNPIFRRCRLRRCDLEGLELPGADFTKADCTGSLFTSTRIPRGIFVGANLQKTGLAEVEWDDADLRDVDFTNASFHLGSSRSGLVGSTIPSEGSRTGFYTDDLADQDFKSPEEIRKACLCGAELSGAIVEKTDFYLVDLRGARYTRTQARHFRGCGAILVRKVG